MSHKHKHNYSNYSKPQEAPVVEPEVKVEEPVVTPEPVADPEVPVVDSEPETPAVPDKLIGVVTNCVKLNVRAEASKEADIVTEILLGTVVQIDNFESTDEFYKVVTATGVEGFCMKKFIAVNS